MNSRTLPQFWDMYERLPNEIKRAARTAFSHFRDDPGHPSLRFKPLKGMPDCWSTRVTLSYRAVGLRDGETITWFWIGSHANFDRDFG